MGRSLHRQQDFLTGTANLVLVLKSESPYIFEDNGKHRFKWKYSLIQSVFSFPQLTLCCYRKETNIAHVIGYNDLPNLRRIWHRSSGNKMCREIVIKVGMYCDVLGYTSQYMLLAASNERGFVQIPYYMHPFFQRFNQHNILFTAFRNCRL